jgi:hypothetical protein
MLRTARRPVAAVCCVLLAMQPAAGCMRVRVREPAQVVDPNTRAAREHIVGVVTRDGQDIRFDATPVAFIRNDSVHATVRRQPFSVALSDVQRVWIQNIDPRRTTFAVVGVTVGLFATLHAIAIATKESCPFVYSWDGRQYVFDAEPYGGAITRGLERDDYSRLEHLRPDSAGLYRLQVTNEVNETQYTNSMRLLVVDHAPGTRVEVDEWGRVYAMTAVAPPTAARDQDGRDLQPWLRNTDRAIWEPLPAADPTGAVRQDIVLTFSKPRGATRALLVANVATGLWGSHMIRELLQLRGAAVRDWYAAMDTSAVALDLLRRWNVREELYVLKLRVEEPGGWQVRGLLPGGGPFISEDRVVPLDVSRVQGDSLRIRIHPPSGFWALNSFGVSYDSVSPPFTVDTILPLTARTSDGRDVLGDLTRADDRYYAMPRTGDHGFVSFRAPPRRPGMPRTVFLHTRGYYRLHLPERGPPNAATIARITDEPDAAARLAAESFAKQRVARRGP